MKIRVSVLPISVSIVFVMLSFFAFLSFQLPAYAAGTQSFTDVLPSHPYYDAVEYLFRFYIIGGYPDGTVRLDQMMNRAEACVLILRAAQITLPETIDRNDFQDVEAGSWYHPCVQIAKERNIIGGYPDGTFRPNQTVNSAEALKMFLESQKTLFQDRTPGTTWYEKYVLHAQEKQVIDSDFQAAKEMSRGAFAELLYRFLRQGPLARVYDSYLSVPKGACSVDAGLTRELENEIRLLPKENEISTADRQQAVALFDEAHDLRDENFNDTPLSVEKFKQVVALDPYFPLAWHYIAMYELNQKGNYEEAMQLEQKNRLLIPDDIATTYAVHGIARAYEELGNLELAEICFKEAIQFMPGNDYPYLRFAQLLRKEGRFNEAIVVLEKGIKREEVENDLSEDLAWLIGDIFRDLKDFHGAELIARKHLASNRDFYPLILLLGDSYVFHAVSPEKAGHYKTVALEAAFLARDERVIQGITDRLKEVKVPITQKLFYEDHVQSTQPFLDALNNYWLNTSSKAKEQALIDIDKAISLNPKESRYLILKARILSLTAASSSAEILTLLKQAKELDVFFYDGYYLEGEVYRLQKKYDAARTAYKKVLASHIDYLNAQLSLNILPK
ncbi:MAG: S-layer homology domain-containing protein [Patescibacteria group bacterium]